MALVWQNWLTAEWGADAEMANQDADSPRKMWHVASWPFLAWLEPVIKLPGLVLGMWSLVQALSYGMLVDASGLRLIQWRCR